MSAVFTDIDRLERQRISEEKASFALPTPSAKALFGRIVGLIPGSKELEDPGLDVKRRFGVQRGGRIYEVTADLRVARGREEIQDKSGSFALEHAVLYRLRDGMWTRHATGTESGSIDLEKRE